MASRLSWVQTVILAGAVALGGCATSAHKVPDRRASYEATALKLGNIEYVSPGAGYDMKWTPIGKGLDYSPSSVEIAQFNVDIDACVSELSKGTVALPSEAARTAQLIACMEPRRWHVAIAEVLVLQ
jgi:hypothetical protein